MPILSTHTTIPPSSQGPSPPGRTGLWSVNLRTILYPLSPEPRARREWDAGNRRRWRVRGAAGPSNRAARAFFASYRKTFHPRGVGKIQLFAIVAP